MAWSDPNRLKETRSVGISGIAFCVARVPDSGRLYVGNSDFKIYEVDLAAEQPSPKAFEAEGHTSYVTGVALSGATLVSGAYDGRLLWWNTESREVQNRVDAHARWIRRLVTSPDGTLVASVADDMVCKVWEIATGRLVHTLKDHQEETPDHYPSMLYAAAFSPDGQFLATGDKVGHIAVWNVSTGEKVGEVESSGMYTWDSRQRRHSIGGIRSLAFSHDSLQLAAGGIGHIGNIDHLDGPSRVEVFNWQKGESRFVLEDNKLKGLVEQLAFDPNGRWVVSGGGDHGGFITFHDLASGKLINQAKAPMHVHEFVMNEDSTSLYAVGHGRIASFDFATTRRPGPVSPPLPEKKA